ncbi:MAG: inorganic diphosphatase [Candidatus Buchananbacteria bacterium]
MNLTKIKIGDEAPEKINVLVEIPLGETKKFELNPRTGMLEVDRELATTMPFPFNYGFIPETLADDGDALDAMILSAETLTKGQVVACRPVAMLKMEDEHGVDGKILCVPVESEEKVYAGLNDLAEIDLATQEKIALFFKHYKETESDKWTKVFDFADQSEALKAIEAARVRFGFKS